MCCTTTSSDPQIWRRFLTQKLSKRFGTCSPTTEDQARQTLLYGTHKYDMIWYTYIPLHLSRFAGTLRSHLLCYISRYMSSIHLCTERVQHLGRLGPQTAKVTHYIWLVEILDDNLSEVKQENVVSGVERITISTGASCQLIREGETTLLSEGVDWQQKHYSMLWTSSSDKILIVSKFGSYFGHAQILRFEKSDATKLRERSRISLIPALYRP